MEFIQLAVFGIIGVCVLVLVVYNLEYIGRLLSIAIQHTRWFLSLLLKYIIILVSEVIDYIGEWIDKYAEAKDVEIAVPPSRPSLLPGGSYAAFHDYSSTQSQSNELERLRRFQMQQEEAMRQQIQPPFDKDNRDAQSGGGLLGNVLGGALGGIASNCTPSSYAASNCTQSNSFSGPQNMALGHAALVAAFNSNSEVRKAENESKKHELQMELELAKIAALKIEIEKLREEMQ
jgi:hypothetical protein